MRTTIVATLLLAGASMGACATTAVSSERSAAPRAAISAAEEAGAEEIPDARLHLKMAKDQIASAEQALSKGKSDKAKRLLERATADAELALELARLESTRAHAKEAWREVKELESQTQPTTKP